MTSSTSLGSSPGTLPIAWRIAWAARSSGRVALNEPLTLLESGVRELATMTASLMTVTSLGGIVEPAALGCKPDEQRGGLPVIAEPPAIVLDPAQHGRRADGVGVEHRAAAVARKPEAIAVDDVDVAGAQRESVLEHARALVGQGGHDARQDLVVGDGPAGDAAARGGGGGDLVDQRVGDAVAAAGLVAVPAGARLLAVAAQGVELIGHLGLRALRAGLADRGEVLADPRADVDAG